MRIVVDINHPAHVHYFKYFIKEMQNRGHDVFVTASKKEMILRLLDNYHIDRIIISSYGNSLTTKMINIPLIDLEYFEKVRDYRPDILIGFGSIRAAHAAFLLGTTCVNFEDTENSSEQIWLYLPFVTTVCTPSCFSRNLGNKQVRFNGYMELASLHPDRFVPDPTILKELDLSSSDPFVILRFVSWQATHDAGHQGLSLENKRRAVHEFEKYGHVYITSEKPLSKEFEKYRITVSPEKMHDLLYYAALLYGESATMASECAVLGTHAIFCDFAGRGYTDEQEKVYDLVYNFRLDEKSQEKSIDKAVQLLRDPYLKERGRAKLKYLLKDKIDVTSFMVWFIENYPDSVGVMKNHTKEQSIFPP